MTTKANHEKALSELPEKTAKLIKAIGIQEGNFCGIDIVSVSTYSDMGGEGTFSDIYIEENEPEKDNDNDDDDDDDNNDDDENEEDNDLYELWDDYVKKVQEKKDEVFVCDIDF